VTQVLFVSKPVAPPFHDGTKCLVRDVARHLGRVRPIVMTSRGAPGLEPARGHGPIELARVYGDSGRFTPGLGQNLRAAAWLLARSRADVWHFVFAPNPRTSAAGRLLRRIKRVPVVQTIASPPRSFSEIDRLLFGDVIVAQSRWTAERAAGSGRRIEVIPPPVAELRPRSAEEQQQLRRQLEIPEAAEIFVYPGDLETSGGAEAVARAVPGITNELAEAVVVFAYRAKSERAAPIARELKRRLDVRRVRFTESLPDVLVLVAAATAVLFPVDDLWGKVDLPIVLLEAMALGVPVVALDQGPLADLEGAVRIAPDDRGALVREAVALARNAEHRRAVIAAQRAAIEARHRAEVVARQYERLYLELAGIRT
jgi:glycosyltransferase involved in cell wall biosynthesis